MDANQVQQALEMAFQDAQVSVVLDGGHYTVTVVSASFEGLRAVARQQRVYAPLSEMIASGAVHAVNIRALTPAEACD
jgi:acid stress-induced BolA-like protein IbaG/YrbA